MANWVFPGWYCPHGRYYPEELAGLSVARFCEAVRSEGFKCWGGANYCLHTHAFFHSFDQFHAGVPSRVEFADRDVRLDDEKQAQGGRWYGFDNK